MGCWDVFCFLCGNPCHRMFSNYTLFLNDVEYYSQSIYDAYIKNPKLFEKKYKLLVKKTKWLDNCTFLCADNKVIHGCKEDSCNVDFIDKKRNIYIHSTSFDNHNQKYGVFIHTDCWTFIKRKYRLGLTYSHLPINIHDVTHYKIFDFVNYGIIERYWKQDFDFIQMIVDNNQKLSESPLKSNLVAKNIKKIFTKLKIRNLPKRIAPPVSATFYKTNTYKVGANGNIWQTKTRKWFECKDTVKITLSNPHRKLVKNIIFIGDYNHEPFFICDIKESKKNIDYYVLSTKQFLLKKKYLAK